MDEYKQSRKGGVSKKALKLSIEDNGSYLISISNSEWFRSAPTQLHSSAKWWTTRDASLKTKKVEKVSGTDFLGDFQKTLFHFVPNDDTQKFSMTASIKQYPHRKNILIFQQSFPDGLPDARSVHRFKPFCGYNEYPDLSELRGVVSAFPSFVVDGEEKTRGYLTYNSTDLQLYDIGEWSSKTNSIPDGVRAGPLIIFDRAMQNTVIISPLTEFMAQSQNFDAERRVMEFGVLGQAKSIPAGYSVETIMFLGGGLNSAMSEWGSILMERHGKTTQYRDSDPVLNYLGYYTDHGAYYYYQTEGDLNYADTLLAVKKHATEEKLPYKHILLDSWWYYKGAHGGLSLWTERPDIFPEGMGKFNDDLGWIMAAHNRWFDSDVQYAKQNGGDYEFIIDKENCKALPTEERFWDDLFREAKKWGIHTYEQDWLWVQSAGMYETLENVKLARQWMLQFGRAAQRAGITIQYCMADARHMMQSVEVPVVTHSRASEDYLPGIKSVNGRWNWEIGTTSIIYDALGVAPHKDSFYTTEFQPGNEDVHEPHSELQSAVATFSTGPVVPGDKIGHSDVDLIMKSCMADGLLLKPDHPMKAIDEYFLQQAFGEGGPQGQVWSTSVQISGWMFGYILAADVEANYEFDPFPERHTKCSNISFNHRNPTGSIRSYNEGQTVDIPKVGKLDFLVVHTVPVFPNGWALLGELGKWVSVSRQRFKSIDLSGGCLSIEARGVFEEEIHVSFGRTIEDSWEVISVSCTFDESGIALINVP